MLSRRFPARHRKYALPHFIKPFVLFLQKKKILDKTVKPMKSFLAPFFLEGDMSARPVAVRILSSDGGTEDCSAEEANMEHRGRLVKKEGC